MGQKGQNQGKRALRDKFARPLTSWIYDSQGQAWLCSSCWGIRWQLNVSLHKRRYLFSHFSRKARAAAQDTHDGGRCLLKNADGFLVILLIFPIQFLFIFIFAAFAIQIKLIFSCDGITLLNHDVFGRNWIYPYCASRFRKIDAGIDLFTDTAAILN